MKLYIGCGPKPFHEQHKRVMNAYPGEWVYVDKYVKDKDIRMWDATQLNEVKDGSIEVIYASHLLEHFPHTRVPRILKLWKEKLIHNGTLILNVPDMLWVAERTIKYALGHELEGYYNQWEGEHGLQSVLYGSQSHKGEHHKSGYLKETLEKLLKDTEFREIEVYGTEDAHDMGVLISRCKK